MKGKFSTAIVEFSLLEKLDQNIKIHAYPCIIWNSMLQSSILLHPKCCLIASIKLLCPVTKNTSCHTWMLKHWAIHTFIPFIGHIYLTEGLCLLFHLERQAPCLTLRESDTESVVHVEVYRITLISLHSRKV